MPRLRLSFAIGLLALWCAYPAVVQAQVYEFTDTKTHDDSGSYSYHAFNVPDGITKIYFAYTYDDLGESQLDRANLWGIDAGHKLGNVIDMAVYDQIGRAHV